MSNNEYRDTFYSSGVVACSDGSAVRFLLLRAGIDDTNDSIAKQHGWDGSSQYMWNMLLHLPKAFAVVVKILGMNDDGYICYLLNRDRFSQEEAVGFQTRIATRLSEGKLSATIHMARVSLN